MCTQNGSPCGVHSQDGQARSRSCPQATDHASQEESSQTWRNRQEGMHFLIIGVEWRVVVQWQFDMYTTDTYIMYSEGVSLNQHTLYIVKVSCTF